MNKAAACTLVTGFLALGMAGQAAAGHAPSAVRKAQQLRASAHSLNQQAGKLEYRIRCLQQQGQHATHLRRQAKQMRHRATTLAKLSNQMMRSNFRPQHQPQKAVRYVQQPVRHVGHRPVQQVFYHHPPVQQVIYQAPQRVVRYVESNPAERILHSIIRPVVGHAIHRLHHRKHQRRAHAVRHHGKRHVAWGYHRHHKHRSHRHHRQHRMAQHAMKVSYHHAQNRRAKSHGW